MPAFSELVLVDEDHSALQTDGVEFVRKLEGEISTLTLEQLLSGTSSTPKIAIEISSSRSERSKRDRKRVRPNHVEYLDVYTVRARRAYSPISGELHIDVGERAIKEAIWIAEQKILQRFALRSPEIDEELYLKFNLVGTSRNYVKAMRSIEQVAPTDSTVLIRGESGTGKEITARAIHHFSKRKEGPFVPINCGAFSDDLLLSELFGYKKGAFTGALEDRIGLLEHADGGTLFLDEIDSLSPRAQTSLLRFLQENEIRPLGSRTPKHIDARVLAASNKNLKTLVKSERFREDLLYRIDVLGVTLPALRQRGEDIVLICQHVLSRIAAELNQKSKYLSLDVMEQIQDNKWPGNFREIESALLRAFIMTDQTLISDVSTLFSEPEIDEVPRKLPLGSFSREKNSLIRQFESDYLRKVLAETNGNVTKAAEIAKKERRAFSRLMAKHEIQRSAYVKAS